MRKREKAGNHDKERTCMCACVCLRFAEGRRYVWGGGGTFEISIWNSHGYRYASCFPPAITAGFPFLFVFTGTSLLTPVTHPEYGRKEVATTRRRAFSIFYDILFPIRGEEASGTTRVLGPYSTFMALNRDEVSREWTSPLRFLLLSSLPSLSLSRFSLLLAIVAAPNLRDVKGSVSKIERILDVWYTRFSTTGFSLGDFH